jgi:hypothetical protein
MIFGFNTDIKANDTVYHVQTEVRQQEQRLESQVFVRGRCIGKRSVPLPPDLQEEEWQELAKTQHRSVMDAIREGLLEEVLDHDAAEELTVHFLGSQRTAGAVLLRFRVLSGGFVAPDAKVFARWKGTETSGELRPTMTNDAGIAEMHIVLEEGASELEVHASLEGRQAFRRFIIKSAKN